MPGSVAFNKQSYSAKKMPSSKGILNNRTHFSLENHRVMPTFLGQVKLRYGYGLEVAGKNAYVADYSNGVAIIDITTEASPKHLSTYSTLPGFAMDVAALGQLLMVANYHQGLLILEISAQSTATYKASLSFPSYIWAVVGQNNKVYLANYDLGLRIVDTSVPTAPVLRGTHDTSGLATELAIQGSHCYVADVASGSDPGGVRIFDVSDDTNPILKSSYISGNLVSDLLARSGLLFAVSVYNIDIIDVSIDSQPVRKARYTSSNYLFKLDASLAGNHLYATSYYRGLEIIDIQNKTNPLYAGKFEITNCRDIKVTGKHVFLSVEAEGLMVLQKQRMIPQLLGNYQTFGSVRTVAIKDKIAFAVDDNNGDNSRLNIIDCSNSLSPILKGSVTTPVPAIISLSLMKDNHQIENIILGSALERGLVIINATLTSNPTVIKLFDTTGSSYSTVTMNNLVFLADYSSLLILNMTNLQDPQMIGTYLGSSSVISLALKEQENIVLLGDATKLSIVDFSNLSSLTLLSSVPVTQFIWGIAISDNIACLANFDNGLMVVDITNKFSPVVKSVFDVGGSAYSASILGKIAYVASYQAGVQMVELSNIEQPEWIGEYVRPGGVYHVVLKNRLGYVAHSVTGLDILGDVIPSEEPIINSNRFLIHRGETRRFDLSYLNVTDTDSPSNKLLIRFYNVLRAMIAPSQKPDSAISHCFQEELTQIQLTHDGSSLSPEMRITVDDGYGEVPVTPQATQFIFVTTPPLLERAILTIHQGELIVVNDNHILATTAGIADPVLIIYINSCTASQFERSNNPNAPIFSFQQKEMSEQIIRFRHLNSETPAACTLYTAIVDLRSATVSANITYINREDPPVLMWARIEMDEGGNVTLSEVQFNSLDPDGNKGGLTYKMGNLQHHSYYSSFLQSLVSEFQHRNITAGHINVRHDGSEIAPSGTVTLQDESGLRDGPRPLEIVFHNKNSPPVLTMYHLPVIQGKRNPVTLSNLDATDSDTSDDNITFVIQNVTRGYFIDVNTDLRIDSFTRTQIKNGFVVFLHDDSNFPPSFEVYVRDNAGLQSQTVTPTIGFTPVNHAPVIQANTLNITEGGTATPVIALSDHEDNVGSLIITVLNPNHCVFQKVEGTVVTNVVSFSYSEYLAGKIRVQHSGDEGEPTYTLRVSDGKGGLVEGSPAVIYTPRDNTPILTVNTLSVTRGSRSLVTSNYLDATDTDTPDNLITFYISNEAHGHFENTLNPNIKISSFTKLDIRNGRIIFVHDNSKFKPSYDVRVGDGTTYSNITSAIINFTPVNQNPIILENSIEIEQGGKAKPNLNLTDPDGDTLTVSVSEVQHCSFDDIGDSTSSPITSFLYSQQENGQIEVVHSGEEAAPKYTIKVSDEKGGMAEAAAAVKFLPVNAPPVVVVNQAAVTAGKRTILGPLDQQVTDDKTPKGSILMKVGNDITHARFEYCSVPGEEIRIYPYSELEARKICLVPTNNEAPDYSIAADDGNLSSAFSKAVVTFTAEKGKTEEELFSPIKVGIGSGVSVVTACLTAGLRYAYNNHLKNDTEEMMKKRAEEMTGEYKPYYTSVFMPVIREVFSRIKTFSNIIFLSRTQDTTKAYIIAIEEIIKELTFYPSFKIDNFVLDGDNKERLIANIVAEIRKNIAKPRCCSANYLKSYFNPEITATRLHTIAKDVAKEVIKSLDLKLRKSSRSSNLLLESKAEDCGIEMQPIDEKAALLPMFSAMSERMSAAERRMDAAEGDIQILKETVVPVSASV